MRLAPDDRGTTTRHDNAADGTIAGCTEDDEPEGCRGRDVVHHGDPVPCIVWTPSGHIYCGVQAG